MANLRQLFVTLSLKADDFNNGLRTSQKEAKEFERSVRPTTEFVNDLGKSMVAVGAAASAVGIPFIALAKNAIDTADSFSKMSQRTGLTAESLSALSHIASLADTDMHAVEKATLASARAFENAATGSKQAQALFEKLGLTMGELATMTPDERFFAVAKAIAAIEDPTLKAGVAMDIWGKNGAALLPMLDDLKGGQESVMATAAQFGQVISSQAAASAAEFNDSLTRMKNALTGVFNAVVASGLLESLTAFINRIATATAGLAKAHPTLVSVAGAIGAIAAVVGPVAIGFGLILQAVTPFIPVVIKLGALLTGTSGLTGALSAVAAVLTGPIGITVAIAGAVAALGYFAMKNDTVRELVFDAWETLKNGLGDIFRQLMDLWRTIADAGVKLWKEWGPTITRIFEIWSADVVGKFRILWDTVGPIVRNAFELIKTLITSAIKIIQGSIQVFVGAVTGDWSMFTEGLKNIWKGLWDAIVAIITAPIKAVKDAVVGFTTGVTGYFKDMYDKVVGHSFVPDMIKGIKDEFAKLSEVMVGPTQSATRSVINSFASMFSSVASGSMSLGQGLKGLANQGATALVKKIPGVSNIVSIIPGIGELLNTGIGSAINAIAGLFGKGRRTADEFVKNFQNPFGDLLSTITNVEDLNTAWTQFNKVANEFASRGGTEAKVVQQAHNTLDPLIAKLQSGLPSQAAMVNNFNITQQPEQDTSQLVNDIIRYLQSNSSAGQQFSDALPA